MAYKFTGRVKEIGIDNDVNFCKFDIDTSVQNENDKVGIAFDEQGNLIKVEQFKNIDEKMFYLLLGAKGDKVEIEFDKYSPGKTSAKNEKSSNYLYALTKVTILR